MQQIGAHVSAAGGVENTPKRAADIGCNCLQLFSGSPRVWRKTDLANHDVDKMFAEQAKYGVSSIFTHAIYLVNLASDKPELIEKSLATLKYDLAFDALVKGSGVIVHLGSHQGRGWETVREQVATEIKQLLNESSANSTLLIENSAGQNGKLNSDLAEIRWLLDEVDSPKLGWCFDTCHAHAAGYALGEEAKQKDGQDSLIAEPTEVKNVRAETALEAINRLELWSSLKVIHVNDSRDEFGSGRDRHANLGEGIIPQADLKYFLNYSQTKEIPLLLEVPGADKKGPDAKNVSALKQLLED
ncbi:MAG: deoxyribonuclease IV [Candidatus Pacebacteria bacterium]|jgi:deoxyribonuclease IV|nr:deoxyribonuclease IV [Candidatus Paceibacterota bacterium]MBT3511956.1 deoxyribonuclease IV [Candidatus Paceibacterota bacterium]MBT4005278.1 deoxyribonuclease IV [Candidatus Paceibacterota bacterium]MBT4358497.1 deoxyribonuclease IV [Candidatus Paceibacterota bacterium]MBT4681145.1 deoxyribonuclease IV [Candidatus Paceibacterota bacterium]